MMPAQMSARGDSPSASLASPWNNAATASAASIAQTPLAGTGEDFLIDDPGAAAFFLTLRWSPNVGTRERRPSETIFVILMLQAINTQIWTRSFSVRRAAF
jgi:hypothetical protein